VLQHLKNTFASCNVCSEPIETANLKSFICCHCCKRQVVFHRTCAQRLAFDEVEKLECPVCGAGEKFRETVLKYGIRIPKVCCYSKSAPDNQQQEQQSGTQADTELQEAEDLEYVERHVSCFVVL